jgi:dolichyl-phosphate-mannose-protein mannosyltransferase
MTLNLDMTSNLTLFWSTGTRSRLYNSTGFFFLCWAAHYLPFYLMGRQLFLHHYLPAHVASALVTGALLEFIFNIEPLEITVSSQTPPSGSKSTSSAAVKKGKGGAGQAEKGGLAAGDGQSLLPLWAASGVVMAAVIGGWWFFLPLTYGKPGLTAEQVVARKWLGYDLHFAK